MLTTLGSERQYKAKILQMKLKRNVESNDRTTVVRHIRYRKDVCDKVTKYVRVYGHRKPEAMIQQWMKDYPMMAKPTTCRTSSRKSMCGTLRRTVFPNSYSAPKSHKPPDQISARFSNAPETHFIAENPPRERVGGRKIYSRYSCVTTSQLHRSRDK